MHTIRPIYFFLCCSLSANTHARSDHIRNLFEESCLTHIRVRREPTGRTRKSLTMEYPVAPTWRSIKTGVVLRNGTLIASSCGALLRAVRSVKINRDIHARCFDGAGRILAGGHSEGKHDRDRGRIWPSKTRLRYLLKLPKIRTTFVTHGRSHRGKLCNSQTVLSVASPGGVAMRLISVAKSSPTRPKPIPYTRA